MKTAYEFVTVLGPDYIQPIIVLCEALLRMKPEPLELDAMTSPRERGYAASICLLTVVCFESFMRRVRYLKKKHLTPDQLNEGNMLKLFTKLFPFCPYVIPLTEAFVLRDVIAHSHTWEVLYNLDDDDWGQTVVATDTDNIDGKNDKFRDAVDLRTRRTRQVGLNVLPSKLNRTDVAKVLHIVFAGLRFLQKEVGVKCFADDTIVMFGGCRVKLTECLKEINDKCAAERGGVFVAPAVKAASESKTESRIPQ